jgi:DNA gyrase subunit A
MLVVTEQGYGKRTRMADYPVKGRGGLGVKTVQLTEARGQLAGALAVREGYQLMLMSTGGTVIRLPVEEVKRLGRSTQGVIVMRLRGDEQVSSIALVAESEEPVAAAESSPDGPEPAVAGESGKNE